MNRRAKTVLASALAVAALAGGVADEASATPRPTAANAPVPAPHDGPETAAYGLVVNVKNNSSYPMTFVLAANGRESKDPPKPVLLPGETDRLAYSADSTGMTVRLTYKVGDTPETVFPAFGVPLMGSNYTSCTANDRSSSSKVETTCKIGSGWEPDAHLTFVNR